VTGGSDTIGNHRKNLGLCAVLASIAALGACTQSTESVAEQEARLHREAEALEELLRAQPDAAPEPGVVRVRLAFGAEADLDLFVTDSTQETAYFANTPTRSGGALTRDLRCEDAAPRIEEVSFSPALKGRYRIGVDFPRRCDDAVGSVSFVVRFESAAGSESRRLFITPQTFMPIAMEVDY